MSETGNKTGEGTHYTIIGMDTFSAKYYKDKCEMYVAKYDGIFEVSSDGIKLIRRLHWWNRWWYKLLHRGER